MEFYDFFPSLRNSQEVYFGRNAPLAGILLNYSEKLINYCTTEDMKSKTFYTNLAKIAEDFGYDVSRELNVEKCQFIITPEKESNASAALMLSLADTCWTEMRNGEKYIGVDLDKVADIEDICVGKSGYSFRNSKNKILSIEVAYGLLTGNYTPEEVAGVICHEIGHGFQQGIFGIYKNVSDICVSNLVKKKSQELYKLPDWVPKPVKKILTFTGIQKFLVAILSYLWFPKLFKSGLFAKFGAWLEKIWFGDKAKDPTYRMEDKLKKWDNGDKNVINDFKTESSKQVSDLIAYSSQQQNDLTRYQEFVVNAKKENQNNWKEYQKELANEKDPKKATSGFLYNFFKSIKLDFDLIDDNVISILALNKYTVNQYAKISFYKRYEFFADVFSTSYGFGADLYKAINKMRKETDVEIDSDLTFGINRIPFFKSMAKTHAYIRMRNASSIDVHGNRQERNVNFYTAMITELKTNPTLSSEQKKAIENDIQMLLEADENFYKESKESGFWYKYYNKLIDERIKGKVSKTSIKEVLKPIEEVCRDKMKK